VRGSGRIGVADAQPDKGRSQDLLLKLQHHRCFAVPTSRDAPDME
jgi:hypothetical protein